MLLGDVGTIRAVIAQSALVDDKLWLRPADKVTELEIQLFYARAAMMGLRTEAIDIIDRLQAICIQLTFERAMPFDLSVIILHSPPESRFYVDELVDGLVKLSTPRRAACLYALETEADPEVVTTLMWHDALTANPRGLAREILTVAMTTRHIRLPYVFWEWATERIAAPLLELQWSVEKAFDCTWPALARRYKTIARIDRRADSASFLELAEEIRHGKL